ncbi:putative ribonuclease H-like domain-containing protein [Tanacetum coccineum]
MRPFGYPVTILNTLDHLGKFDRKADEGFLVGYSINSKAFRVFNSRTRKVKENLHVNFLENKPNAAGSGPEWLFDIDTLINSMNYQPVNAGNRTNGNAGLEKNSDAGQAGKENVPDQEYILLPLLHTSSNVPLNSEKDGSLPKDDAGKKNEVKDSAKEGDMNGPGEATNTNNTNRLNTVSSPVNTVSSSFTTMDLGKAKEQRNEYESLFDPLIPDLEDTADFQNTGIFGSAYIDEYVGVEADLSNLETNMTVSPIPTTKIHKDHPKSQIIGEVNSAVQTRRMHKQNEAGLISFINKQRRINHKDFQNCLFACFLSQMEPKKVTQALDDESLVEAMQEELLQFKLLNVWTLVDLPHGKKVIGTKWVFRNKRDQRGIVVRNKARLVAHGYRQEEENGFTRGTIDKILFIKKIKNGILLVQVYVDDIIFGSTKESLSTKFEQLMHKRFQMSSMGELTFFLGLQCKKQTIVANSTTEAEYIAASNCCGHVLWLQNQLLDYGYNFMKTKIHVDNESAIRMVKNPVYYSKTNHIEIRHHFIRYSYEKKLIEMVKIHTDYNVVDLLTKAFDVTRLVTSDKTCQTPRKIKRGRDTKVPHSGAPLTKVGNEAVHKELGDRIERAVTTASSLEAEHDSDAQTRFEAASKSPMIHLSQEVTHLEVGRTVCNKWN